MDIVGNKSLGALLDYYAKTSPEKVLLYYKDSVITYMAMNNRVNQVANLLQNEGIKKGDKVGLICDNRPEFYEIWFGAARLGAVLVPINPVSTEEELQYFIQHSESKLLFIQSDQSEKVAGVKKECPTLIRIYQLDPKIAGGEIDFFTNCNQQRFQFVNSDKVEAGDICCIMYTSGTTSKPKGVQITHHNYLFAGEASARLHWLTDQDIFLIFLPLFHANSQYYATMPVLTVGASIVLLPRFSATTFWADVKKYRPTISSLVSTAIKILLQSKPSDDETANTIRRAAYGLFISKNELEEFERRFRIKLYQIFGMTESIVANIATPLYGQRKFDPLTEIPALGKPSLSQEVKVVDETGAEVSPGSVGQIIIKSPSLMAGYYKNQLATEETIREGWLYTGDNGYMDDEGYFWFVDRKKDMIKRSGENVSTLEVEGVLAGHPAVEDVAVVGVPDPIRDEAVKAFIKIKPGKGATADELREYCSKRLSPFRVPQFYEFVDDFPRTSIGKIQKNILRQR